MVLVVDDDAAVLEIVAEFLEDLDYRVIRAADGAQALALLAANPEVALLLTDISMPAMSGVELARQAVRLHPTLKILLMSGYADTMPVDRMALLRKPFTIRKLADMLRATLAAGP